MTYGWGHEASEAEKMYPHCWKTFAPRQKTSQALLFLERTFHFLDRIVLFLDLDCLTSLRSVRQLSNLEKEKFDLGNEKLSLGKETSPSSFSSSEQSLSSSTEHIFHLDFQLPDGLQSTLGTGRGMFVPSQIILGIRSLLNITLHQCCIGSALALH